MYWQSSTILNIAARPISLEIPLPYNPPPRSVSPCRCRGPQVAESAADAATAGGGGGGGGGGAGGAGGAGGRFHFVCGFCKWSGLRPAEGAAPATVSRDPGVRGCARTCARARAHVRSWGRGSSSDGSSLSFLVQVFAFLPCPRPESRTTPPKPLATCASRPPHNQ